MATGKKKKDDSYYPLRWKFADSVENIIILHRTKAAIAIAILGIALVIAGLSILGFFGSDDSDESADGNPVTEQTTAGDPDDLTQADGDADAQLPNDDNIIEGGAEDDVNNSRPTATDEQLLLTPSGTVIQISGDTVRLVGGFPSEEAADESLDLIIDFFGDFEIIDDQIIGDGFDDLDSLLISIVDPTLFADQTAEINPRFFGVFDAVSDLIFVNGNFSVNVRAHVEGQELSDIRAEAVTDRLVSALVDPEIISAAGFDGADLAAGQTSRIDFLIG